MVDKKKSDLIESNDKIKELLQKLLSSDIVFKEGESEDEFVSKLKERALPILENLEGVELIATEISDMTKKLK